MRSPTETDARVNPDRWGLLYEVIDLDGVPERRQLEASLKAASTCRYMGAPRFTSLAVGNQRNSPTFACNIPSLFGVYFGMEGGGGEAAG